MANARISLAGTALAAAVAFLAPAAGLAAPSHAAARSAMVFAADPNDDPAVDARAQEWYRALSTGEIDRSQLSDAMRSSMTDESVKAMAVQLSAYGEPTAFTFEQRVPGRDGFTYVYRVDTPKGPLDFEIGIGWDASIISLNARSVGAGT